ncbi:unnamed protein product [Closterium sp. NIES-54]
MTSLHRSGGSGDCGGGGSGSGGCHPSSRCGAVRWGVSGGGQMRLQQLRFASAQPLALCLLSGDLAHTAFDEGGWRCVGVRVSGSRAFVRDTYADKLSARAIPCIFLGSVPVAPGWQFYHPTSRRVFPSQDVTFHKSVPFYRLLPYSSAPPPPPPLFLAPAPPLVDPLPPHGPTPSGVSQVDPLPGTAPVQIALGSSAAPGAASGGAEQRGAESEVAGSGGAKPAGVETGGIERGVLSRRVRSLGWFARRPRLRSGATGARDAGDAGAGGAGVTAGAGGAGAAATGPGGARTRGTGAAGAGGVEGAGAGDPTEPGATGAGGSGAGGAGAAGAGAVDPRVGDIGDTMRPQPLTERREPASRPVSPVRTAHRVPHSCPPPVPDVHAMALRPSSIPLRVSLPAPPESSLPEVSDPESNRAHAASPTNARLLATATTDPSFESAAASALVVELLDFAAACRLDYATALVAESEFASPPFVGGECALRTDVLEDRYEDFECLAAAVPRFASMLLALVGDPDAPDIPTPRSYAEAITVPYSSQWQATMDAEMASWKSTGTYIDEVPPPGVNIVDGMWIFRVKRPPGSPPVFKARYVGQGFS